jgi:peptide/nickel transport system substrate-binding protein
MSSSHPTVRRVIAASALTVGVAMLVTSCSVANSDASTESGSADTVRIVLPQEPPTLEACDATLTSVGTVNRSNITEPLIERNADTGTLDPLLATKWEATSDTEWTFTLRDDVKFQDGTPFDAEAAAFSIDRAVNKSDLDCHVRGFVFGDYTLDVKAVNATTLTVTTPTPDPILPLRISFIEIVPSSTSNTAKVREPIGTGPYKIDKWDAGTKLTLARNDDYWGDAPAFKDAEFQWRAEGTIRAAMLTSGEADLAQGLGVDDGAGDLGLTYTNGETVAVRFSGEIAPLNDIRVRQAINYAIDTSGIVDSLYKGANLTIAAQLVPKGVVGHNDDLKPWKFDLAKAKELVAAAKADGVPVDQKITIVGRNSQFPKISEMAQVIQEQLTQAGLNIELKMVDTTQALQYQQRPFVSNEGAIGIIVQHGNQAGDAAFTVDQYMSSDGFQSTFGTPELDALIKDAATKSGAERQAAYAKVFAVQNESVVAFAHIAHMTGVLGKAATVNYTPNSATGDELRLAEITPAN